MCTNPIAPSAEAEAWLRPSVIALVLANLVPVAGVLFLGWEVFPIIFLFWAENLVVGALNALKMLLAAPDQRAAWAAKAFMVPFFCFHYGMFCLVHGVFVIVLFGAGARMTAPAEPSLGLLYDLLARYHLGWGVLALAISHGISFVANYVRGGEYRVAQLPLLMAAPYARIVILHITILVGGFLLMALGSPSVGLLLLVLMKILVDIRAHLAERRRYTALKSQIASLPA